MAYQMHVLVKFLLLLTLAVALTQLAVTYQIVLFVFLITGTVLSHLKSFSNMLRRVRWLLVILLIIYAFSTPGEYVRGFPIWFSPSYEGIQTGLMQVVKVMIMLAALSVLLTTTPRGLLIGGIYQLLSPFSMLKVDAKRFAVRIWLTMHYVESNASRTQQKISSGLTLEEIALHDTNEDKNIMREISISIMPFAKLDIILVVIVLISFYFLFAH
ncbi:MAG: CbiQ family ECF transporter T component [Methylophilus sp.]